MPARPSWQYGAGNLELACRIVPRRRWPGEHGESWLAQQWGLRVASPNMIGVGN